MVNVDKLDDETGDNAVTLRADRKRVGKRIHDYQASEQKPSQIGSEEKRAANTESEKYLHSFVNGQRETIPRQRSPRDLRKRVASRQLVSELLRHVESLLN